MAATCSAVDEEFVCCVIFDQTSCDYSQQPTEMWIWPIVGRKMVHRFLTVLRSNDGSSFTSSLCHGDTPILAVQDCG